MEEQIVKHRIRQLMATSVSMTPAATDSNPENDNHNLSDVLSLRLHEFANLLRDNGICHDAGHLIDSHTLAGSDYLQNRKSFRHALKTCFCHSYRDWIQFDALFDSFWRASGEAGVDPEKNDSNATPALSSAVEDNGRLVGFAGTSSQTTDNDFTGAGDYKALSLADFRFVFNNREKQVIERLVDDLARRSRKFKSRRKRRTRRGTCIDMRRSFSHLPRYSGTVAELSFLQRRNRLPRFVLLLDVSQSMEIYSRLFLRFSLQLAQVFQHSDIFAFNTRLISLGSGHQKLSESGLEAKLNSQSSAWLGGTRIAHALTDFQDNHGPGVLRKSTTVVVFSDGCDTDPPEVLAPVVKQLQAGCKKLIWVNPLLGRFQQGEKDRYMDPVTPYIDQYCSAHNLQSLKQFSRYLLN